MIVAIKLELIDADVDGHGVYTDYIASFERECDAQEFIRARKDILLIDTDIGRPINTAYVSIGDQ